MFAGGLCFEPTVLQRRTMRMLIKMSTIDPKTARAMVRLDHELTEEEEEAAAEDPFEMSD